jgi:hypothetical protein
MVSLKQTGVIRIQVAVIDASKIPEHVDVCVDRGIYRIYFTVDKEETDDLLNPDEDDLLGDDSNNGFDGSDHVMEDAPPNSNPNGSLPAGSNNQSKGHQSVGGYTPRQQAALVSEAIELASEQLLEEICCKMMMEPVDAQDDNTYSPPSVEERATFDALVAASIQAREADGTSKEQPDKGLVWESTISTAVVPETEPLGKDHTTALDVAPLELIQVGDGLGGVAAPAAGVISTCSLAAPGGMPVEPPLPSQPAVVLAVGGSSRLRWWLSRLLFTRSKVCMLLFLTAHLMWLRFNLWCNRSCPLLSLRP